MEYILDAPPSRNGRMWSALLKQCTMWGRTCAVQGPGRCEIWIRTIEASAPREGFTCA